MIYYEKLGVFKYLMPYVDHLTYQFCVVKPQFEEFAEKYMPEGYDPMEEYYKHLDDLKKEGEAEAEPEGSGDF